MCSNPWYDDNIVDLNGEKLPIPCGHCFCCRLDFQKTAIDRMFCAWCSHEVSAFVTFTYDDEHLVFNKGFCNPTLVKDDVHRYLDKIRHQLKGVDFEYYLCGEYGDQFNRPHYHAVFFGLDYQLHEKFFCDSWKKGSVKVLPVSPASFRYVAKYLTNPVSKEFNDSHYYDFGLIPPFRKMSRGLGLSQYFKHLDELNQKGYFYLRGKRISVNRYYFNKLLHYSDVLILSREKDINDNRRRLSQEAKSFNLSLDEYKTLRVLNKENALKSKQIRQKSTLF